VLRFIPASVFLHPGAMFADIGNFDEKGIDTHRRNGIAKSFKMHVQRASGNDDGSPF
jgi:hypothetical protein